MKNACKVTGWLLLCLFIGSQLVIPHLSVAAQDIGLTPGEAADGLNHPGMVSYRVGSYFLTTEEYPKAIIEFTETIRRLPTFAYAYSARGDCYMALGQYDLAIADYNQALILSPEFASAYYTRGLAYAALGKADEAILDFNQVISLAPEVSLPYRGLGDVYYVQGNFDQALANYQHYLLLAGDAVETMVLDRVLGLQSTVLNEQS
jgi:tetratricopeptide (TPR) repeat protein